jgi:hypothetical protein
MLARSHGSSFLLFTMKVICLALCDTDKIMSYDCTHSFVSGLVLCFVVTAQSHVSINLGWVAWINSCHLVY